MGEEYTVENQLNSIESKLDQLLAIWHEFEPFIRQANELMNMKPSDKVKTLLMGKKNGDSRPIASGKDGSSK